MDYQTCFLKAELDRLKFEEDLFVQYLAINDLKEKEAYKQKIEKYTNMTRGLLEIDIFDDQELQGAVSEEFFSESEEFELDGQMGKKVVEKIEV